MDMSAEADYNSAQTRPLAPSPMEVSMRGFLIPVFCLFLAWPLSAVRADEPREARPHPCFRSIDADRDGRVTPAEFNQAFPDSRPSVFQAVDLDRDGCLIHDEYHRSLGHGRPGEDG